MLFPQVALYCMQFVVAGCRITKSRIFSTYSSPNFLEIFPWNCPWWPLRGWIITIYVPRTSLIREAESAVQNIITTTNLDWAKLGQAQNWCLDKDHLSRVELAILWGCKKLQDQHEEFCSIKVSKQSCIMQIILYPCKILSLQNSDVRISYLNQQ